MLTVVAFGGRDNRHSCPNILEHNQAPAMHARAQGFTDYVKLTFYPTFFRIVRRRLNNKRITMKLKRKSVADLRHCGNLRHNYGAAAVSGGANPSEKKMRPLASITMLS